MLKRIVLLLCFFATIITLTAQTKTTLQETVIFLVRHAEKVDNSNNPKLSDAGIKRAIELAETLASAEINYIHSTDYIRTRETVAPFAKAKSLSIEIYDPRELENFAELLLKKGGRHLVVGHSNTTPQLVELLGGKPGLPIVEKNEYDRLYILSFENLQTTNTVLLRYGENFNPESH